MQLKKTAATLDELTQHEDALKQTIRESQRQLKTVRTTRKQLERLTAAIPAEKPHRRSKKAASVAAA